VPLFLITPPAMKARLVAELGFDAIVEQAFTREFASQSAEEFVAGILERNLGISHAVTGFDFHFGKDRRGGPAFLMASGERAWLRCDRWSMPVAVTRAPRSSRRSRHPRAARAGAT